MTEDILAKDNASMKSGNTSNTTRIPRTRRVSLLAAVLSIFLAVVMIMLGERVIFDLNSAFNPIAVDADTVTTTSPYRGGLQLDSPSISSSYASESSALSASRLYYPRVQTNVYSMYKLMIHSAVIIPVFLLMFVLYFWASHRPENKQFTVIVVGYLVFAFWMMLHLLGEAGRFILQEYRNVGVYVVLIVLAAMFTWLMIVLQKRINQHHEA
jgi:hypothetical protein